MSTDAAPPSPWIRTSDRLPERVSDRGYHTWCLVYYKGDVRVLPYNHHDRCWDDDSADDYECDPLQVSHWMPLPAAPAE